MKHIIHIYIFTSIICIYTYIYIYIYIYVYIYVFICGWDDTKKVLNLKTAKTVVLKHGNII